MNISAHLWVAELYLETYPNGTYYGFAKWLRRSKTLQDFLRLCRQHKEDGWRATRDGYNGYLVTVDLRPLWSGNEKTA